MSRIKNNMFNFFGNNLPPYKGKHREFLFNFIKKFDKIGSFPVGIFPLKDIENILSEIGPVFDDYLLSKRLQGLNSYNISKGEFENIKSVENIDSD